MSSDVGAMSTSTTLWSVRVDGVSKSYQIPVAERELTLTEQGLKRLRHPFQRKAYQELAALHDLDLTINAGEAVGLIGRNGAGKSTLLKVLSRITPPTTGSVRLRGRVGSLLEVGTGFHPELTGRENVFLAGAILGMKRREIARSFESIVDFAGVAKFLDLPVKRYSSGMYVRLAFAVAAHMDTEILLVDEVLAVGDSDFQKLSSAKMQEVVRDGRTVVLVSHQMRTIADICSRAVVLDRGTVAFDGTTPEAIARYVAMAKHKSQQHRTPELLRRSLVVSRAEPTTLAFAPDDEKTVRLDITYDGSAPIDRYFVSTTVRSADGVAVAHCDSNAMGHWYRAVKGTISVEFTLVHPWLVPGEYYLDIALCNAGVLDTVEQACWFSVHAELPYPMPPALEIAKRDLVLPRYSFSGAESSGRTV
jgi:lipopolysaccharide transport system ATP-binding protein